MSLTSVPADGVLADVDRVRRGRWVATDLAMLLSVALGTVIVLLRDSILPDKFSYDSDKIQAMAQGSLAYEDRSFTPVATVYRTLGLADRPALAAVLGFGSFVAVAVAMRVRLAALTPSRSTPYLFAVSIVLGAVYLGVYSKDVFVVGVVAVAVLWRRPRGGTAALVALAVIYGSFFRTYWLVVAAVVIVFVVLLKHLRSLLALALSAVAMVVVLGFAYALVNGAPVSVLRAGINDNRGDRGDALTQIPVFVHGGGFLLESLNLVVTLGVLVVPLPLLLLGSVYHVFVAVGLLSIWVLIGNLLHSGLRSGAFVADQSLRRSAALLVAILVTQALFEPDYGSALRHLVPFLLIAIFLSLHLGRRSVDRVAVVPPSEIRDGD